MTGVFVTVAPRALCKLSQFISDETGGVVGEEVAVHEVQGTGLTLPLVLPDVSQPAVLLLFDLVSLIDIGKHDQFLPDH